MSFTMKTLTEGIRQRHMGAQHQRLTEKWNRTGLLRGLDGYNRENMAVMLENQAAQLLRESNSLGNGSGGSSGDIRGFQNVAFPIVRRVFGGLVANELVSIQPMSLPSGLLFYLDYTYGNMQGGIDEAGYSATGVKESATYLSGSSIYNNPTGKGIQSGSLGVGGNYDLLGSGYSRRHDAKNILSRVATLATGGYALIAVDATTGVASTIASAANSTVTAAAGHTSLSGAVGRLVDFDPVVAQYLADNSTERLHFIAVLASELTSTDASTYRTAATLTGHAGLPADLTMLQDLVLVGPSELAGEGVGGNQADDGWADQITTVPAQFQGGKGTKSLRRHTKRVSFNSSSSVVEVNPLGGTHILFPVFMSTSATNIADGTGVQLGVSFAVTSSFSADQNVGDALTIPSFEANLGSSSANTSGDPIIPEIDIKIESLAVTAVSRKLKAKWSPELAQDLNAYHSLDAEVELTQILSEQIALELDREILNDLLVQANGANLFWSRAPGKFVNKLTGVEIARNSSLRPGPQFTGTVRDWYETLIETIIDAGNIIHRKTLRGSANFIVIGPDVATILEASVMYKPSYSLDGEGQASAISIGAEKIGNLSNRFTVYKDPYFPRNKILVGYKGGSYLETGYVYAPYVPLIVTPTIFAPEDFTPRKGVMTRYGKKMVRSDFYGTVTCMDMNII